MAGKTRSLGWAGQILKVDLTTGRNETRPTEPYTHLFLGGRGINTKLIFDELEPKVRPFDPANLLCIGAGALSATPAPSCARASIAALSPRGLLDYSGLGGFFGPEMKLAGLDNLIITGRADKPVYLFITNDSVQIKDASTLWGLDPWQTQQAIRQELGDRNIHSLAIGAAGENLVHFAAIATGRLTSAAGRFGLGAVMGSKNLKAVAVRGKGGLALAQPARYLAACLDWRRELVEEEGYRYRRDGGADKTVFERHLGQGGKFVAGNWEPFDRVRDGLDKVLEDPARFWAERAGHLKPNGARQPGCQGCPMYHHTVFDIPEEGCTGNAKCTPWLSLSGPVWLTDRADIVRAVHKANRLGLDAVSAGNAIGFLMELYRRRLITEQDTDGLALVRGDIKAVLTALEKMGRQEGFGRLFRKGVDGAARQLGRGAAEYAMTIKGLEIYPEELRAYKSLALMAAVGKSEQFLSPEYAWTGDPPGMEAQAEELFGDGGLARPTRYEGKAQTIWLGEQVHGATDLLGLCKLVIPWGSSTPNLARPVQLFELATGRAVTEEDLLAAARRSLLLERAFNAARGLSRLDETLPRRFFSEPAPEGRFKGEKLDRVKFEAMKDDYYALSGCDAQGRPLGESFRRLDLASEERRYIENIQAIAHDEVTRG